MSLEGHTVTHGSIYLIKAPVLYMGLVWIAIDLTLRCMNDSDAYQNPSEVLLRFQNELTCVILRHVLKNVTKNDEVCTLICFTHKRQVADVIVNRLVVFQLEIVLADVGFPDLNRKPEGFC